VIGGVKKSMTEIDFETIVSAVSEEIDRTWSELLREDSLDLEEVREQYKRNATRAIRVTFDKAEAIAEIEERFQALQQELLQLQSQMVDLIQAGRGTVVDEP